MIPDQLRLIPVFVMLTNWHLIGNFSGYILINLVTAVNLFFMRQYFLTIPRDFEEAAKLDGAGYFKTFWRIMLPLARPGDRGARDPPVPGDVERLLLAADPLRAGQRAHVHDPARPRRSSRSPTSTLWPELMAGSLIAIAPILVIFLVFQRYFIAGVTAAGVKG